MQLTFFDLDNTLLIGDSDYEWGRFLVDEAVVDRDVYARANEHFMAQYEAGALDIHAYQRLALAPLVSRQDAEITALRSRFVSERIMPIIAPQTGKVLGFHRQRGDLIAIITATNRFVAEPIADLLGVPHLIATEPAIKDGRYTGEIAGTPCYQDGKIIHAREFLGARETPIDSITFYSDSHNDLPMMRWADRAIAVDPDARLAAEAARAGWPVVSFRGAQFPAID